MPAVELVDMLRKDRELDDAPVVAPEHFDATVRYNTRLIPPPIASELAAGTVRIPRPSSLKLAVGCVAAFVGGFALTIPLWW